jgi:tape measure domain-containing protein
MSELVLNLKIRANADGTAQVINGTADGINRISKESGNASNALRGIDSAASGLMRTLAPLVGFYQLISFGHKVVDDTAAVQDLDTRLHSLTKTAGDYAQTVDYITTVAEAHHKKINDLSDGYAKLRNLQNSGIITGQQTKGILEGLDNAASDLGASNEKLGQTYYGVAQGLAAGVLHAEELNQVTEPLPGLMQSLDKAAGLASGGFRRLTNDGKVTSQMFAETLVNALHDFDGAAAATAQNINAKSTDISNSWTRLVKSVEPTTSALWTPIQDGAKDALDSIREFNEAAITVGDTNVSASNLAKGAWDATTQVIKIGWASLEEAGLGAAADTVSGWIVSGDQMKSNVKFLVNDMIGLFVGFGHSVGIITATVATNFNNMIDNTKAKASAMAGDVARMGVGDFSFSSSKAVVEKPMVNAWDDIVSQLKTDLSTDYIGTFTKAVEGAAVAHQKLTDEQKKATDAAEQAKAKTLQAAAAHNTHGNAAGQSAEASKKAVSEAKKRADAIANEIAALNDQHQKLTLSERAYEQAKLAAMGMEGAVLKSAMAVWESNKALEAQKAGIDAGQSAMDAETERYNKLTQSVYEYQYSKLLLDGVSPGKAIEIVSQTKANDDIEKQRQAILDARSAFESYNNEISSAKSNMSDFGSISSAVFDGALGGISAMTGAFSNMIDSITQINVQLDEEIKKRTEIANAPVGSFADIQARDKAIADSIKKEEQLQTKKDLSVVAGTRQVAGAVSRMFAENTKARQVFHNIEMTMAAVEMAMQAKKIATELWGMGQVLASELASVGPSIAASTARTEVKGLECVVTAGSNGDAYTAPARMALMAAILAGLGVAVAGGLNSGSTTLDLTQPETTGKGTVLGDPEAISQSLPNIYTLLKDIHAEEYPELKGINAGVNALSKGIDNSVTKLFQSGGITAQLTKDLAAGSTSTGSAMSSIPLLGGLFGGGKTTETIGGGLALASASISDILAGAIIDGVQYTTIKTVKKGGLFSKDKTTIADTFSPLDASVKEGLTGVFKSAAQTMLSLTDTFGNEFEAAIESYVLPPIRIELAGLSGKDAVDKVTGVVSSVLDNMASSVFGGILKQYQQLGEGMLETAVRLVSEVAVVKDALGKSGLSIKDDAIAISDGLAQAAGGLREFQAQFDSYYQKYYSETERSVFTQKQLNSQLSDVNLLLPETRDGYRAVIEALDINNAADQQRYSLLIKLSSAADAYYKVIEDAAEAAKRIAEQRRSLEIQLLEASGNAVEALTQKRRDELASMDASLRFTQQGVWAVTAAQTAVTNAQSAVTNAVNEVSSAVTKLTALANKLRSSVSATAVQTDALLRQDRANAMAVLRAAVLSARSGGSIDDNKHLEKALADLARPSTQLYATFVDYARDQMRANNDIAQLADLADAQVSDAQRQIDAIKGTTNAVLSVQDAIAKLSAAIKSRDDAAKLRDDTMRAIDRAQKAETAEGAAKSSWDAALKKSDDAAAALANKIAAANKAAQDATAAQENAKKLATWSAAPTTWQAGQSNNPIWEKVLADFNAAHSARYGIAMNRPWTADADAQRAYSVLVAQYNAQSAATAASAQASADALLDVAKAAREAIPAYQTAAAAAKAIADAAKTDYQAKTKDTSAAKGAAANLFPEYIASGGAVVNKSAGTFYNAGNAVTVSLDGKRKQFSDLLLSSGYAAVYERAKYNGLDSTGLDLLMNWTPGTAAQKAINWKLPAFASGGDHEGGWRLVGERGPEIEYTPPSRIFSNQQSRTLFDDSEIVAELRRLREEVKELQKHANDTAENTKNTARTLQVVTRGGRAMQTEAFS